MFRKVAVMKNTRAGCLVAFSVLSTTAASGEQFDRSVTALTKASFVHLKVAYGCQRHLGVARYHEAHIAVENALRATGLPTHVAMAAAEDLAKEARASNLRMPDRSSQKCFATFVHTKNDLNRWRAIVTAPPSPQPR
ncbi:hypothetical protein [Agrobacterium rosae]|uniref:Uncharacterized protein n=1 Tax=Agrobacterium rosae TaxID=1972867 RepID=A0AAE5RTF7_9HYPH|nr:hypothetical protein [Agrobacterium rosae]KAA3509221.1 hypothetical protein DXM21_22645 [Agrobacterium rosae]KAA3513916.1 hypothetical protein DXM25_22835 [Agrobacterium rosae]MQB50936.1 hypothetical protein [Agrobacterium rosae]POO48851.1 hypothetical protein CPJ18_23015 [Agrobacterium rosae]